MPSQLSAWNAHLASFRSSHPTLTLKQCMKGASKTYQGATTTTTKTRKTCRSSPGKAERGGSSSWAASNNPWIAHVQAYRSSHSGMSYSDALKHASRTYRGKGMNWDQCFKIPIGDIKEIAYTRIKKAPSDRVSLWKTVELHLGLGGIYWKDVDDEINECNGAVLWTRPLVKNYVLDEDAKTFFSRMLEQIRQGNLPRDTEGKRTTRFKYDHSPFLKPQSRATSAGLVGPDEFLFIFETFVYFLNNMQDWPRSPIYYEHASVLNPDAFAINHLRERFLEFLRIRRRTDP